MAHERYRSCIDACYACAAECDHCATACLYEPDPKTMAECVKLDIDCAEVCRYAAGAMARDSQCVAQICGLCAEICDRCGAECEKHNTDHCQACAVACRRCADECRRMVG